MQVLVFYLMMGLAIMVAQTTILRLPLLQGTFYDLLIPLVIFVRMNLPTKMAAVLVLIIGLVVDIFSGGQLGLYLSVYFWIFIAVKGVSNCFNLQGSLFRSVLIALCVMAEHVILAVALIFPGDGLPALRSRIGTVVWQIAFAAVTGPAILVGLERFHQWILSRQNDRKKRPALLSIR